MHSFILGNSIPDPIAPYLHIFLLKCGKNLPAGKITGYCPFNSVRFFENCVINGISRIVHRWAPQGFWGSEENGYLFSWSWGALVIILGEQAHNFGDLGSIAKKNKEKPPF